MSVSTSMSTVFTDLRYLGNINNVANILLLFKKTITKSAKHQLFYSLKNESSFIVSKIKI